MFSHLLRRKWPNELNINLIYRHASNLQLPLITSPNILLLDNTMQILAQLTNILFINLLILLDKRLNTPNFLVVIGVVLFDSLLLTPGAQLQARLQLLLDLVVPGEVAGGARLALGALDILRHVDVAFEGLHVVLGVLVD